MHGTTLNLVHSRTSSSGRTAGCVHEANPINVTQNLTGTQMNAFIDMIIGYACVKNEHNQYCAAAMLSFSSSVNGGGSTDTTPSPAEMCRDIVLFEQVTGCCAGNALAVDHTFEAAGLFPSSAQTMMKSFFAHCALQIPAICSGTASEVAGGVPGAINGLNTGGTGNSANTKQSAGAIAGIVIGAVALVGVAVLGGAYVMHTKKAAPTGYSPTYDYAAST